MKLTQYLEKYHTCRSISRFQMYPVLKPQNLADHQHSVGTLFYLICKELGILMDEEVLFVVMNHDFAECYTGDLSRVIKMKSPHTEKAWNKIEDECLEGGLQFWTDKSIEGMLTDLQCKVFKLSDSIDGMLYCYGEYLKGNQFITGPMWRYAEEVEKILFELDFTNKPSSAAIYDIVKKVINSMPCL